MEAACANGRLASPIYSVCVCVVIDQPELKHIDQIVVKQSHTAATTFILEAVKNNADKSTIRYASSHTRQSPPSRLLVSRSDSFFLS